GPHQGPGQ
nr:protein C, PP2C=sperm major basic chromosomal protein precursor intermediate [mice, Inbred C57BL, epididymis, testis, Peptide Partial, 8 aa] [Mus sp.]